MLEECIALAVDNVRSGGIPFAGLVVVNGQIVGRGVNRVRANLDPTAHAEVMAVRDACAKLGTFSLAGARLFASAEPCGLCLVSAAVAGISQVIYAFSADEAAELGFDYRGARRMLSAPAEWPFAFERVELAGADLPFRLWQERQQT